jgi:arginyl-tRNA synthetase
MRWGAAVDLRAFRPALKPLKQQLEQLVRHAVQTLVGTVLSEPPAQDTVVVERARDAFHGDFATHVALRLAKGSGRSPHELAQLIVAALPESSIVMRAEVSSAGFINFVLAKDVFAREVARVHELGDRYGHSALGEGQRVAVHIESSSVELDVIDGRRATYCEALANVLAASGFTVERGGSLTDVEVAGVTIYRGGARVELRTFQQLRDEVGDDACRFFYLLRNHDQHLDFDLQLARSRTDANPLYPVQYAHARVASLMKELGARGFDFDRDSGLANLSRLESEAAQALITVLLRYPETVEYAAVNRAPHSIVYYLRELASAFHTCHNAERAIVAATDVRNARVALSVAVAQVIRSGLGLVGVSAPESM